MCSRSHEDGERDQSARDGDIVDLRIQPGDTVGRRGPHGDQVADRLVDGRTASASPYLPNTLSSVPDDFAQCCLEPEGIFHRIEQIACGPSRLRTAASAVSTAAWSRAARSCLSRRLFCPSAGSNASTSCGSAPPRRTGSPPHTVDARHRQSCMLGTPTSSISLLLEAGLDGGDRSAEFVNPDRSDRERPLQTWSVNDSTK